MGGLAAGPSTQHPARRARALPGLAYLRIALCAALLRLIAYGFRAMAADWFTADRKSVV